MACIISPPLANLNAAGFRHDVFVFGNMLRMSIVLSKANVLLLIFKNNIVQRTFNGVHNVAHVRVSSIVLINKKLSA